MKILITGGSGLIGFELVRKLQTSHEIIVLDKKDFTSEFSNVNFIHNDLNEIRPQDLDNDYDGIIHLAALSRVIHGELYPLECWSSNVEGTNKVISAFKLKNPQSWMIYGSSREIYGEPKQFPVSEKYPSNPINRYGISKFCAENIIKNFYNIYDSPAIIFRFSNVYGSLNDHADRVIPKFINLALEDRDLELHGSNNIFDFTYIEDTIDGILSGINLMEQLSLSHQPNLFTFNLCTGNGTSLEQLAQKIISLTNSKSSYYETESRNYDVSKFIGDYSLANKLLHYEPKFNLDKGLEKYINLIKSTYPTILEERI